MKTLLFWTVLYLAVHKSWNDLAPYWYARKPFEWVADLSAMIVGVTVAVVIYAALDLV